MKRTPTHASADPIETEIRLVAHRLWLESGQIPGLDIDNWLFAKELLRRHSTPPSLDPLDCGYAAAH